MTAVAERPSWLADAAELEQMSPPPRVTPESARSWVKLMTSHAEESWDNGELPRLMRLWFAAVGRIDSEGRADFNSGELAEILDCAERTVRSVIAQGKRAGQLREESDARHVYLVGVVNARPSAKRLAKRRRVDAIGQRYRSTRPRE